MIAKASTPCCAPGCGRATTNRFCESHKALASNWGKAKRTRNGSTRAWRKVRARILARDMGLCQLCLQADRVTVAREVDHIRPITQGGTDRPENLQSLCTDCHKGKSAEDSGNMTALFRPYLPMPGIPVTVVCGCPGSGKTTYVHERMGKDDIMIDLDQVAASITGQPINHAPRDRKTLIASLRERNRILRTLARKRKGKAWMVIGAPRPADRLHWREQLNAEIIVIETPLDRAIIRINRDPARAGIEADNEKWAKQWWVSYMPHRDDTVAA